MTARHVVSAIGGMFPPALRRTLAGLWLDARGLPRRLTDPARRAEPWQALHNVGGGDFARAGHETLALLRTYAGLTPQSRVLDVGCGAGRMAWPLAGFLDLDASYVGFDVAPRAIAACRRRFGRRRPDFQFLEADLANAEYRPKGQGSEAGYRFPAGTASVDIAFATSVFSHMRAPSIRRYLDEAARVLAPEGAFLFTAYALTPDRIEALQQGRGPLAFRPWRDGAMVVDPRSPERAIAHRLEDLVQWVEQSGLILSDGVRRGAWLGPADYPGWQDLFVARRPMQGRTALSSHA